MRPVDRKLGNLKLVSPFSLRRNDITLFAAMLRCDRGSTILSASQGWRDRAISISE
jgi:hypothetical protein